MGGLRKALRKLRFLVWPALAFALFSYCVKPLQSALWKPLDPAQVCGPLQRGEAARDRWGNALDYDARTRGVTSPGPDHVRGTSDDVTVVCE